MELMAAIRALETLKEPCRVRLYSDSAYLVNAFNQGWLTKWQGNGWMTAQKKSVENRDLWLLLLELAETHQIEWIKVKGHGNNPVNNRCDELATTEAQQWTPPPAQESRSHFDPDEHIGKSAASTQSPGSLE
jgi:ribonuclease HI